MNNGTPEALAKSQLLIKLVQHGIVQQAAQEAAIQSILSESPKAAVDALGDITDIEKANQLADAWLAAHSDSKPGSGEADPSKKKSTKPASSTFSAEDIRNLDDMLNANAVDKEKRLAATRLVNVLTDKPCLYAIHVAGTKLIPNNGDANLASKFAKWQATLVDTAANKQAFEELKAEYEKGSPMEVYINTEAREKVIGYTVETTDDNGNPDTRILTKETAIAFLLFDVPGYIPARNEDTSIGMKLRWQTRSQKMAKDVEGQSSGGTSVVSILNRKAMKNNKDLSVCTCQIKEVGGQKETNANYSAKTAKFFEVKTGRVTSKGEPINRKVRLSGKTTVYAVQRIAKYDIFGPADSKKGSGQMTRAQREKQLEANRNALNDFLNGTSGSAEIRQLRSEKVRAMKMANAGSMPSLT